MTDLKSPTDDKQPIPEWKDYSKSPFFDRVIPAIRTLGSHLFSVEFIAFNPAGTHLASVSTPILFPAPQLAVIRINTLIFSPTEETLAIGNGDGTITIWNLKDNSEHLVIHVGTQLHSLAFSPDGKILASEGRGAVIKLWDVVTGQELKSFEGHKADIYSLAFSPDGKTLASGSIDKTIRLWDVVTGHELKMLASHIEGVTSVTFNPDGETLASGSFDRTIRLWDVATGQELLMMLGHSEQVNSLTYSPDGQLLASAGEDIKIWQVETGKIIKTLRRFNRPIGLAKSILAGHEAKVFDITFSPDGEVLVSGDTHGIIKLWDTKTSQEINSFFVPNSAFSLAFHPGGNL